MSKRIYRVIKVKNTLSVEAVQNAQIHQKKTLSIKKKDSNQIDKNENNINKQLTETRHNNHENYLQSKNLKKNQN